MSLAFLHERNAAQVHDDAVWGVAWTSRDKVLSISADGSLKQWNPSSGELHPPNASEPPAHTLALISLSASVDGALTLTNSIEGLTTLWDLGDDNTGEVRSIASYESFARSGHDESAPAWSTSLHPNGETYASTGASGTVTIHSAQPQNFGERLSTLSSGKSKFAMHCRYSPDGKRIALASETGQAYLFDVESQSLIHTYSSHAMAIRSLCWSPDGSLLLTASEDKRLSLLDARVAGSVASFIGHSSWVLSSDISPDGRLALSGSADKSIKVWDIGARTAVSTMPDTVEVWSVSWRPKPSAPGGSGEFVSGGEDGVVRFWRSAGSAG